MKDKAHDVIGSLTLANHTVIEAKVSDHNPIINNGVLSFNIMMQGRYNLDKKRYNNGFGLEEDTTAYQARLKMLVQILAETADLNPSLYAIGLVEAPVKPEDIDCFIYEAHKYPSLRRFYDSLKPHAFTKMGVATLIDQERFEAHWVEQNYGEIHPSLADRVQTVNLREKISGKRMRLCNLHFPFDLAKGDKSSLLKSFATQLFNTQDPCIVMGDFNMHPDYITEGLKGLNVHVIQNNNILAKTDDTGTVIAQEPDTVDGILCQKSEKLPACMDCEIDCIEYGVKLMQQSAETLTKLCTPFLVERLKELSTSHSLAHDA